VTDEPILRRGDHGEWVGHLQRLLAQAGHDPGPVDGRFGDRTQDTVRAYQRAFGLAIDGVVGPDTWFALHLPSSVWSGHSSLPPMITSSIGRRGVARAGAVG
jgi:murein L,D-transpeptidase YcbB/YkuD